MMDAKELVGQGNIGPLQALLWTAISRGEEPGKNQIVLSKCYRRRIPVCHCKHFLTLLWFPIPNKDLLINTELRESVTRSGLLKLMKLRCYSGKERIDTLANLSITRKCGFRHSV